MRHTTHSEVEQHIITLLRQISFGKVEVTIHDSRVVQIEKCEKQRFNYISNHSQEEK